MAQAVKICGRNTDFYVLLSVYWNPRHDDSIYDCLLTSMAEAQRKDHKPFFIIPGDFNVHHVEWLESVSNTDHHGTAAHDVAAASGCRQLVEGPIHDSGNILDLVITDVPCVVDVQVLSPIGKSDHAALV